MKHTITAERNYRRTAAWITGILLVLATASCKKFVEVPNPPDVLTTDKIFADNKTANSAVVSIYTDMMNDQFGSNGSFVCFSMTALAGMSANELTWTQSTTVTPTYQEFTDHLLTAPNTSVAAFWKDGYKYIYRANAILEGIASSTGMTPDAKKALEGEVRFIRAFCYFYLVNLFGDVPLVLTTPYQDNMVMPRTASTVVWEQILTDLVKAKELLADAYSTADRIRPNKATAAALLARVYLYTGKWAEAENEANAIISNPVYGTGLPILDKVFKKDSPETIWQLQPVRTNSNTLEGATFIVTGTTRPNYEITPHLLSAFEANDNRKTKWIGFSNPANPGWAYPSKYKAGNTSTLTEFYIVFRLTEQYLIRSEARAKQGAGKIALSLADLNAVRSRAGLLPLAISDQQALLLAIEKERQVELFTEWGHRWLDLKRTNRAEAVLKPLSPSNSWKAGSELYPVPAGEILKNIQLQQNAGY